MTVTTRRRITGISITVDMCLLVALVIGTSVQSHPRLGLRRSQVSPSA